MLRRPTFRSCFRVELIAGEGLLVLTETDYRVLKGHVERLAPLLKGELTTEEIVRRFEDHIPAEELYYTLNELESRGYISDREQMSPSLEAAYWDGLGVDAGDAARRLEATSVSVTAFGNVSADSLIAALKSCGVRCVSDGDLNVVVTDDYLHDRLAAFNREAVESGRPYLLVKPTGMTVWIGPIVIPRRTGCWECLAHRLRLNRPALMFLRTCNGRRESVSLPRAGLSSTMDMAIQMAATETLKWIVQGGSDSLEGRLMTFDTSTLETRAHTIVRRPQCPCCGDPSRASPQNPSPPALESRKKNYTGDGGHRAVRPEETLWTYQHHISPLTGVVSRLKRLSDPDDPLVHSYSVGHNIASRFEGSGLIHKNLRDISGGKGRTDLQARVSGLCEGIERCSGIYQGDEASFTGKFRSLGSQAIHPNECMCFSEHQYRERYTLNSESTRLAQWIPEPFDEDREMEWSPVWSLCQGEFKHLPTAYCYYGYPPEKSRFCRADSNGNAAGNTLEEAILQGFFEVVERDSVALWWYSRLRVAGVDLDSFGESYFEALRSHYHSINRELWVLDVTTDLDIPAFVALSRRTDSTREDIVLGFGAHFDARLGVLRALTELNQVLPAVLNIEDDADGMPIHPDKLAVHWWNEATLESQPYLKPSENRRLKVITEYAKRSSDDLLEDIRTCERIAEEKGLELLVLDQTRPDLGMPVVKVVVPGLRHYWPRFGPGRLFDVPVQQGWLTEPLAENQLNPFPIFF